MGGILGLTDLIREEIFEVEEEQLWGCNFRSSHARHQGLCAEVGFSVFWIEPIVDMIDYAGLKHLLFG